MMDHRYLIVSPGPGYPVENGWRMRQFKWIEWNPQKIDAHALTAEDVEAALDRVFSLEQR